MRIAIAQLDPIVGDVPGNIKRMDETMARLDQPGESRPDLVVLPEMFLTGYPPKDLLERTWFVSRVQEGIERVIRLSARHAGMGILFGAPVRTREGNGKGLYNAALLVCDGQLVACVAKRLLPTYDVFDEARYFDPGQSAQVVTFRGEKLGIHICEDAWTDSQLWPARSLYTIDPVAELAAKGATVLINISASPYSVGKEAVRYRLISRHAKRHSLPFVYINQIGGNDDLIFDGRSLALDAEGNAVRVLAGFAEDVQIFDTAERGAVGAYEPQEEIASVHDALVLGVRDYLHKCGFSKAVVGLSGGIDSAVTMAIATAALGQENVLGVSMPSRFSSDGSKDDARDLAANLGIPFKMIPIEEMHNAYLAALAPHFAGAEPGVAEENIQARIRGNMLMAISNKFGYMVLSTGNKSELAVGYCTLYGDMSGGLAIISDLPKMMVYDLARYMNRERIVIPLPSIEKPPSAELRPDQKDEDSLPPYDILDAILHAYVEEARSVEEIVALGFEEETVRWVTRTVNRNEYKRQQAAPGLKVTTKAFGVGRRMPIAARF